MRLPDVVVTPHLLAATSDEPITFVNAPGIAEQRGIGLRYVRIPDSDDHRSLLRVTNEDRDGRLLRVAGTVHSGSRERLVEVWNTQVDVAPTRHMAFLRYQDRPGIIGTVGDAFAQADVNIAGAQVGRAAPQGDAVMVLSLDGPISRTILDEAAGRVDASAARLVVLEPDLYPPAPPQGR